jgi:hypothetical protein
MSDGQKTSMWLEILSNVLTIFARRTSEVTPLSDEDKASDLASGPRPPSDGQGSSHPARISQIRSRK